MNGGIVMSSYKDYEKKALQNPEVKAEYDVLQPEQDIIQTLPTPEKSIQQIEKEQMARLREKAKKGKIMLDE